MRTLAALVMSVWVLTAAGAALAASKPYPGTVQSVDAAADTVTLDDGTKFYAGPGVEIDGLKPGTKVIFYYYVYDGRYTVVSYELVTK